MLLPKTTVGSAAHGVAHRKGKHSRYRIAHRVSQKGLRPTVSTVKRNESMTAQEWVHQLQLESHPEGGYYRETYHASRFIRDEDTYRVYGGDRRTATSIYFLLERHDVSKFHRLKSDELWYFHAGHPLTIHIITPDGDYHTTQLGLDLASGEEPQRIIPANHIFGATVDHAETRDAYTVVSCMVSPGFDFADFELFERETLLQFYPQHESIITRLT